MRKYKAKRAFVAKPTAPAEDENGKERLPSYGIEGKSDHMHQH